MINERGSILIGVLGLSFVMTIAAGGFILLSGNTTNRISMSHQNLQLHHAAESGMHLAVRWTRSYSMVKINNPNWATPVVLVPLVLTQGIDGYQNFHGYQIKVTLLNDGAGFHQIRSFARGADHTDSLEISATLKNATGAAPPYLSTPELSNWIETIHRGK